MKRTVLSSRLIGRGLVYLAAILIALWILIPVYLITMAALSPREMTYSWPKALFPQVISLETMRFFLNAYKVLDSVRNSVIVALLTLVFPIVILSIPLAVTFRRWGMYDSLISVALLHVAMALPTTILVTSSVFMGVPRELEEAATVFGCNRLQAFIRVALPLALPGLAASAIFTFVLSWNEVFASTILTLFNRTLPALLIVQLDAVPVVFRFAGGFFILIPAIVFMFFIRRYLFSLWGITLK
jgi:multiple sugar transport system permease protein